MIDNEIAIRAIVASYVESYASGFSDRHIKEKDDEDGTINMKIHNVFIAALGSEIQYYSALARSLDSSLGNMLEKMAIRIASLHYSVSQHVEDKEQTDYIAELLERSRCPRESDELCLSRDFWDLVCKSEKGYDIVIDELQKTLLIYDIEMPQLSIA